MPIWLGKLQPEHGERPQQRIVGNEDEHLFGEVSISSKSRPVLGNNKEPSSDLLRHYRQIKIKAVAGASAKTAKGPHRRLDAPIAANRKEKTNHEKEDSDE
jgi:hypothetical protein